MTVSIIVAMASNRAIGVNNDLPWHIPADLKFFKKTTLGKPIIMGRKTFDSIGRALPGRQNIVITRNKEWSHNGVDVVSSVEAAIAAAGDATEIMITGGAQIYEQALAGTDRMYITEIEASVDGEAFFPEFSADEWAEKSREYHAAEDGQPAYSFVVHERV